MRTIHRIAYISLFATVIYSCSNSNAGSDKMAELEALKKQKEEIQSQIVALEAELVESGQLQKNGGNKILISTFEIKPSEFFHKVELRGAVSSRKNVMLMAETSGKILSISASEGQRVTKGEVLAKLDAAVTRNSIAEVQTQLELADEIYKRQQKLWDQKIGTEVQYLQAKSNKESLERRLQTLNSQLQFAYVKAPFSGVVDDIPVNVGQVVQPGVPLIRLVNPDDTYISADVSESFLGKFSNDQQVEVYFPALDKRVVSKIKSVGAVIKSENRTFEIEVDLPRVDFPVQPNQVVVLKLVDYTNEQALTVPTKLVQRDSKGSFVYEIVDEDSNKVAKKVHINVGVSFDQVTEVKDGLQIGQLIAHEGYRDLAQNVTVTIAN